MFTMLAEVTSGQFVAAVAAGVVAGAGALKGFQYRQRNGNGSCKPGHTTACIDHMMKLTELGQAVKFVQEDVTEIKRKLDQVLER